MSKPRNFLNLNPKTHSLDDLLFSFATNFYLTCKWLELIFCMGDVGAKLHKGNLLQHTLMPYCKVYAGLLEPYECIGPSRVLVENSFILSLGSKHTINPSPGWNSRGFLKLIGPLSGSKLSLYSSFSTSNPICVTFRTSNHTEFKSSSLLLPCH